jgi:putative transposase
LQAFLESWFRYLKERVIWRNEFETIDQARAAIGAYVDHYHDRPHLGIDYRTPKEEAARVDAREEFDGLQKQAA